MVEVEVTGTGVRLAGQVRVLGCRPPRPAVYRTGAGPRSRRWSTAQGTNRVLSCSLVFRVRTSGGSGSNGPGAVARADLKRRLMVQRVAATLA
ncbi:hypothetical protein HPB50_001212 [Hyalomma asiaticum]|uniref:Uncharacterized protein n=1 Tax=Hyalomma asiaticum TaxID=266040 RepID=A0ACB7SGR0_HYAAI|nr:hypothetical protein HPB50_001212 [Hyalomma asiaticum]